MAEVTPLSETEAIAQGYTVIKTAADLDNIRNNLSGKYMLMNDIDLSGINWDPIDRFKGTLDGNGFVIKNLTIDRPDEDYVGLFGKITDDGTKIQNLGLENVTIKGNNNVSAMIGYNELSSATSTKIENCYVTGTVTGNNYVGGLTGYGRNTAIYNCYSLADIAGNIYVAGISGHSSTIKNSFSSGNIKGNEYVGGIIGFTRNIMISSLSTANISGNKYVGGIIGYLDWNDYEVIENNYFDGNITCNESFIGGILGGSYYLKIKNCFWNKETTSVSNVTGKNDYSTSPTNTKGLTTAEMQTKLEEAGWTTITDKILTPKTITTITGGVEVSTTPDEAFDGQLDGLIKFSNGKSITVTATDTRTQVLEKINAIDGMSAQIYANGKIAIIAENETTLQVVMDETGFTQTYGLSNLRMPGDSGGTGIAPAFGNLRLQVGANSDVSANAIFVDTTFDLAGFAVDFSDAESCAESIQACDELLNKISVKVSEFGTTMGRLEAVLDSQTVSIENLTAAKSTIMDSDIAKESADYVKSQILQRTTASLLVQAQSINNNAVLQLVQG